MADDDIRSRLTFAQFVGIYLASLALGMLVAFGGSAVTGINPFRLLCLYFTAAFGLGAANRPWWWSATLRSTGWFSSLPNGLLTWLFVMIAVGTLLLGVLGAVPSEWGGPH
jgi:hypothetical protein